MKIRMICLGESMLPTLRPGDLLDVAHCDRVEPGDVIVYLPPGGDRWTVHRVFSVDGHGIRTRGDNNRSADPDFLQHKDILGRVTRFSRGRASGRVFGGSAGRVLALLVRALHRMNGLACRLLSPMYHRLCRRGLFRRLVPAAMRPRVLSVGQGEAQQLLLFMGRRMVGRRRPGEASWEIRRPYRLFVDAGSLPGRPFDVSEGSDGVPQSAGCPVPLADAPRA